MLFMFDKFLRFILNWLERVNKYIKRDKKSDKFYNKYFVLP